MARTRYRSAGRRATCRTTASVATNRRPSSVTSLDDARGLVTGRRDQALLPVLEAAVWAVAKSPLRDGAGGRAGAAVKGGAEHGNTTANQRGWNTLPLVERERAAATTSPRQSFFSPPSGRAATPAAPRASDRAGGTCDLGVLRFPRSMRAVLGTSVVPVHRKARDQGSRALACSGRIDWLLDQAGRKRASSVFSARVLEQRPCQASPYVMVNHSDQTDRASNPQRPSSNSQSTLAGRDPSLGDSSAIFFALSVFQRLAVRSWQLFLDTASRSVSDREISPPPATSLPPLHCPLGERRSGAAANQDPRSAL